MSLPREWNLQDSRGSLYCPSELQSHQSGGFICSSTDQISSGDGRRQSNNSNINNDSTTNINNITNNYNNSSDIATNYNNSNYNGSSNPSNINASAQTIDVGRGYGIGGFGGAGGGGGTFAISMPHNNIDIDYAMQPLACSQPTAPSLLTECQQSSGSLFSVVSAPPLAELDVKQVGALAAATANAGGGGGITGIGGGFGPHSFGLTAAARNEAHSSCASMQRRPITLPIGAPYSPAASTVSAAAAATAAISTATAAASAVQPQTQSTTAINSSSNRPLHASLLEHQISEIEEDDNENLLTVSSITARPLIAKSREICTSRQLAQQPKRKQSRRPGSGGSNSAGAASIIGDGSGGGALRSGANGTAATGTIRVASSSRSSENADPPDGGYGWLIVFGAFSVQFWVAGLVKSYGVLYVEIMETFESSTATVASWIPAILSALCLALAPLSSALCQRFSCRAVVFVGGLFCAFGLTLSYFATSLLHLLFTFGILTGIGGGLSTTPGIVIVSQYFDKHRALANGICVSGTAVGSFILPVLIKHLAEKFGFHGTILILGGCMLHVCLSAMLYKPFEQYIGRNIDDDEELDDEQRAEERPLNDVNPSNTGILTNSTYLDTCDSVAGGGNAKFIEHLFMEETKNRLNDYYSGKHGHGSNSALSNGGAAQESDDEVKDMIGETTFIKPMKKVRSSGIMHSVEDLSTDSTWVYRKHSGTDSNRGSRRRKNAFGNDEIISKIQAHLEKPLSPPAVVSRGLSKSMEIPTPVSNLSELKSQPTAAMEGGQLMYGNGGGGSLRKSGNTRLLAGVRERGHGSDGGISYVAAIDDEDDDEDDELNERSRTCCERIKMYLDISLLKDPIFILMCMSVVLMSVGCPYMLYYLPAHVISIGYNKSEAGYLVAISAVLDLCGRLGLGYLSDLQLFDRRKTYVLCILGAGLAVLTIPSADTLYLVGLSAAIYGACLGSWYVLMPVLLADIFGTDRISSSYGLVRMFQSIGAISVPPLAGYLRDLSGSYVICFYCMGTCMVLGCLPLLLWALFENRMERKLLNETRADSEENSMAS